MCCVTKATSIHFINGKRYIKQLKSRKSRKTCLTNHMQSKSHKITPLVIIALGVDTQTQTQTQTQTHIFKNPCLALKHSKN